MTIGAIPMEDGYKTDSERSIGVLETKLKALTIEQNQLTNSVKEWIKEPGPNARTDIVEAARVDADMIAKNIKANRELNNNNQVVVNFSIRPRTDAEIAAGIQIAGDQTMTIDQNKNQIQLTVDGKKRLYHADSLKVFQSPEETFANTSIRIQKTNISKRDTIVIVYSVAAPDGPVNALSSMKVIPKGTDQKIVNEIQRLNIDETLKYMMFLHAVQRVFSTIQQMSPDGTVRARLVQINAPNLRYDLMENKSLPGNCNVKDCDAKAVNIENVKDAMDIMNQIVDKFPRSKEGSNHLVLSLSVPGSLNSVHIVDTIFSSLPSTEIKLLDQSWILYLSPIIEQDNFNLDMFFEVTSSGDPDSTAANNRLLDLSYRLTKFLAEFRAIVSSSAGSSSLP